MEERRPGQHPEADRPAGDGAQNRSVRPGAEAGGSPSDETARIRAADERSKAAGEALAEGGFGDHKGVDGFPAIPREG